jgi:hypothetical protein
LAAGLQRLTTNAMVVCAEVEGEAVLLDVDSGFYYGLDEIGTLIWRLLGEGANHEGIVQAILAEYDASVEQVTADVDEFVGLLISRGLAQEEPV